MFPNVGFVSVDIWTALVAGVATFFTPCILPVIPGFIAYFIADKENNLFRTTLNAVGFVVGLSFVFINMGVLSAYLGGFIEGNKGLVNVVSGLIVIAFGIHIAGIVKIPFVGKMGFNINVSSGKRGFIRALVLGLAFSVVWSPCLSPTLGAILIIASKSAEIWKGAELLLFYSVGMGIMFVATAMATRRLLWVISKMQRYQRGIEIATGVLLVVMGVIIACGKFDWIATLI